MRRALSMTLALGTALLLASAAAVPAAEPVKVVASFSILADFVAKVGGDRVEVAALVGPDSDAHVYEPSPADARRVAAADLVVVNGLGFEGWLERLVKASGYKGEVAVASSGVATIPADGGDDHGDDNHAHAHGEDDHGHAEGHGHAEAHGHHHGPSDPHAWQSAANAVTYAGNIAEALCRADQGSCELFRANAAAYQDELRALHASIAAEFGALPPERRKVITTHDAFRYFGRAYGIEFIAPQGVSTESEASAADVARLIQQVRAEGVTALFVENVSDPRLLEQIARETGTRPGGALYSDALSGPDGPAPTYVDMMRHNARSLASAMQGS
ncbi:metal ABC transporter solute-binding protein, Zn/Mn family [Faunimonas sp. B44]|uniref:metal ABC transporter solute-binding protein, Zn/Mn family n=1 Tax=Faunimonas sp. B44 TaxID=3461493 RepID=UPI0040439E20